MLYTPQLRYLVVVLAGDSQATRDALPRLQPSSQALADAHTGGQLVGVIVTAQGGTSGSRPHRSLLLLLLPASCARRCDATALPRLIGRLPAAGRRRWRAPPLPVPLLRPLGRHRRGPCDRQARGAWWGVTTQRAAGAAGQRGRVPWPAGLTRRRPPAALQRARGAGPLLGAAAGRAAAAGAAMQPARRRAAGGCAAGRGAGDRGGPGGDDHLRIPAAGGGQQLTRSCKPGCKQSTLRGQSKCSAYSCSSVLPRQGRQAPEPGRWRRGAAPRGCVTGSHCSLGVGSFLAHSTDSNSSLQPSLLSIEHEAQVQAEGQRRSRGPGVSG